jgi:hypothetical protein
MTVILDDVACILHIPIVGRLMGDEDVGYETCMELLQRELGMTEAEAMSEVNKQWGGYISIPHLKIVYDRLMHICDELEQHGDEEEAKELDKTRAFCIKAFLFLLVGVTIFANKNSNNVHLLLLTMMQDLDTVHDCS